MSSFFTCFPSSATLATTNILESAGGHTQVQMFFIISVDDGRQVSLLLYSKLAQHQSLAISSQLSGLFTSLVVLIVLLLIGPLFYFLPKVGLLFNHSYRCGGDIPVHLSHPFLAPQAVLACINVTSLRQMFLQFQDLPELWKISKIDFVGALGEVTKGFTLSIHPHFHESLIQQ